MGKLERLGPFASTILLAACANRQAPPPERVTEPESAGEFRPTTSAPIVWPVEIDNPSVGVSAQQLCDHVLQLMVAELGGATETISQRELEDIRSSCLKEADEERLQVGEAAYAMQAECILRARDLAGLEPCNRLGAASGDGRLPSNREVCEHIMDIMEREFAGTGTTLSEADWAMFIDKCATDLADEAAKLGPVEYERQVRCVMAGQKIDELVACDPNP